jgi:hypothetical protein
MKTKTVTLGYMEAKNTLARIWVLLITVHLVRTVGGQNRPHPSVHG